MSATIDQRIPELVSVTEAARMLQCSTAWARHLVNTGQLAARRVGGAGWVIRREVVEGLVAVWRERAAREQARPLGER